MKKEVVLSHKERFLSKLVLERLLCFAGSSGWGFLCSLDYYKVLRSRKNQQGLERVPAQAPS